MEEEKNKVSEGEETVNKNERENEARMEGTPVVLITAPPEKRLEAPEEAAPQSAREERREERRSRRGSCCNFGRLIIGMCVVFAGFLLLAKSLNYLPEDFTIDFVRFWPILIVVFGLSILDARDKFAFIIGFVVTLLVVIMFALLLRGVFAKDDNGVGNRKLPHGIEYYSAMYHPSRYAHLFSVRK